MQWFHCGVVMKYFKIVLSLFIFTCFCSAGFCDTVDFQGSLGGRLNLKGANEVSTSANNSSSLKSNGLTPFLNAELNGMGSMIQAVSGNGVNYYTVESQRKLEAEYAKQQVKSIDAQEN